MGLGADAPIWQHSSFRKNRERLLKEQVGPVAGEAADLEEVPPLLSNGPFSVDGPLLQAWPSHGSLQPVNAQQASEQDAEGREERKQAKGAPHGQQPAPWQLTPGAHWACPGKAIPPCSAPGSPAHGQIVTTKWWIAG